jgi:hypothetical protein
VRRVLEKKLAEEIVAIVASVNRELILARERLRTAALLVPSHDLPSLIRAVLARSSSASGLLSNTRAKDSILHRICAPGGLARRWQDEMEAEANAAEEEGDPSTTVEATQTWQNAVFDVAV